MSHPSAIISLRRKMRKSVQLLYNEITTNRLFSSTIFWSTVFVSFLLLLDLVEISNGNSGVAFFAVLKTIYVAFGTIVVLEYKKPNPVLESIRIKTW